MRLTGKPRQAAAAAGGRAGPGTPHRPRQWLRVWSVAGEEDEGGESVEQRLYVHSSAKQEKEDTVLSTRRARFEAELRQLQ